MLVCLYNTDWRLSWIAFLFNPVAHKDTQCSRCCPACTVYFLGKFEWDRHTSISAIWFRNQHGVLRQSCCCRSTFWTDRWGFGASVRESESPASTLIWGQLSFGVSIFFASVHCGYKGNTIRHVVFLVSGTLTSLTETLDAVFRREFYFLILSFHWISPPMVCLTI